MSTGRSPRGADIHPWSTSLRLASTLAGPAFVGLGLFVAAPFLLAVVLSFTDLRLGSPLPIEWVGLEQYRRVLTSPTFRRAFFNNVYFTAVVVPVQTALALAAALLLDRGVRGTALARVALLLPVVFPMALIAVVWELLYAAGPDGPLNALLGSLTLGLWTPRDFLRDPALAMPAIMVLSIWQGMGFQMVILSAGLQAIPDHLHEAAALDGAGPWGRFRHVTLPGLKRPLVLVGVVTAILSFRLFDQVRILTRGGPEERTTTVMYEAVTAAFDRQQVALSAAMSVIFFLVVLSISLVGSRAGDSHAPARTAEGT
ncbi:MAG: sugar ABC transporter permease [Gemmatimonadota bacterium]|nr:sugar ABC transporter permease [Gemmatimonadota bacterium]